MFFMKNSNFGCVAVCVDSGMSHRTVKPRGQKRRRYPLLPAVGIQFARKRIKKYRNHSAEGFTFAETDALPRPRTGVVIVSRQLLINLYQL